MKLEKIVKWPKYPQLEPKFNDQNENFVMIGHTRGVSEYKMLYHSGPLEITKIGGLYDIDTTEGQNYFPTFL